MQGGRFMHLILQAQPAWAPAERHLHVIDRAARFSLIRIEIKAVSLLQLYSDVVMFLREEVR
jgi:hypothetical protein